jgi:hypothetical protein
MKGAMRSYSFLVEVEAIQPDCEGAPNGSDQSLNSRVSSPGESHPEALAELYVSLSTHTAPIMEPRRAPICQWANNSGALREIRAIQCVALRRWRRSFLYFCLAQRARSRSSSRMVG